MQSIFGRRRSDEKYIQLLRVCWHLTELAEIYQADARMFCSTNSEAVQWFFLHYLYHVFLTKSAV